jgi:2-polyprenyl-3-methyl-5-hydroxy-6-metoxy-1,4-benzoquinol methylase
MQYDPIKRSLGAVFNRNPFLRKLFYRLLDILLLRSWHIKKELRAWSVTKGKNSTILDAGSGFGQYTYNMSTMNPSYSIKAVDVKEEQIADCNSFFTAIGQNNRVKFEYADLTIFNEPNTYDLILSVDVMEHILEDVTVFRNFYSSMKDGGMLLISTPSDQGGSDVHDDHEEGFVDEHVRDGYNIIEIADKLKSVGFKNIEARYSYGCPGKIAWKFSMKYPILLLNASKLFFVLLPFYYVLVFPFVIILNFRDLYKTHKTGTGLIVKAFK